MAVKFISYNGSFPNLCSGNLKIEVDGKVYEINHALCSGGSVWFDEEWSEHVESGPWTLARHNIPNELLPYRVEIERLVNKHVEHGCCGGCV